MRPSDSLAPFGRGSGLPLPAAYLDVGACSSPPARAPTDALHVGDGSPALRITDFLRGEARASRVTGSSSSCVPWSYTPPDTVPSSPMHGEAVIAFRLSGTLGIRDKTRFRGRTRTAHTLACLRFAGPLPGVVARLATGRSGLTRGRAGFAPAGRQTKFHEVIASSTPLRPALPGRTRKGGSPGIR